ncbi:MAG TPA: RDD family protein, partial [Pyrinomonadaceae bacterium]|nr:RDD family protein [Pyrinomonadaceae bacterium]HNU08189.1 RDD family protein [Pyrinomonadaceae bacterium]
MDPSVFANEETLIIETPERVPLAFSLASIGNRFIAVAIDHFIQMMTVLVVVWGMLYWSGASLDSLEGDPGEVIREMSKWTLALMVLIVFAIFAGYFAVFEWIWNGQTPGKRLMKLRVIREDGRPITFWEAVARNLLRIFDSFPMVAIIPFYSIGLISVFASSRDQRVGDLFAGTVVVRERTDEAPTFAETFSNQISDAAFRRVQKVVEFRTDIKPLTHEEIEVVEAFLRRRWDLTERQRLWMAWRVALPIMYKLKPDYSLTDFTYEGFLEEILHRFHQRQKFIN